MRKTWIKRFFPLIAFFLLLPWPVAYATSAGDPAGDDTVTIEVAEASVKPSYKVFGQAIGSVNPGDLFYVNATDNSADIMTTLSLTNANELVSHYTYLFLKVGVYVDNDGTWEKASDSNGESIPETILSMRNGQVSFLLPGYGKYKITIDGGSFYAINANDDGGLTPQLYLEVN